MGFRRYSCANQLCGASGCAKPLLPCDFSDNAKH
ncbi:Uncharacterised protein [Vibrio cholerae]|nr:Uncharacterised protein [Vibrio cholerae]